MTETPDIEILGFLLTDSARHLRAAFERRISEAGLGITPAEARTLLNVHALKDCRQLDIAARMGIEPMTVCTFLDKLQAQGLIERHPTPWIDVPARATDRFVHANDRGHPDRVARPAGPGDQGSGG